MCLTPGSGAQVTESQVVKQLVVLHPKRQSLRQARGRFVVLALQVEQLAVYEGLPGIGCYSWSMLLSKMPEMLQGMPKIPLLITEFEGPLPGNDEVWRPLQELRIERQGGRSLSQVIGFCGVGVTQHSGAVCRLPGV